MTETIPIADRRELLWLQHPRELSERLPDAYGLGGMMTNGDTCCDYCAICRDFCICDTFEIECLELIIHIILG